MPLTFKAQIEDLIGTTAEAASIDQWLQDGAWDIINRVKIVDPMRLQSFAKQEDISNNTASVSVIQSVCNVSFNTAVTCLVFLPLAKLS